MAAYLPAPGLNLQEYRFIDFETKAGWGIYLARQRNSSRHAAVESPVEDPTPRRQAGFLQEAFCNL